ncbi:saccharopine dehydrogenase [Thermoplasmatales archaeon ex4484_6]|nr:MAG: saccharopine dehydrogenase [Thermoplasmatales archaeon ex4484_6]
MKDVLVLGAGLVARPLVDYLVNKGFEVTVASRTVEKAERITRSSGGGNALRFDIEKDEGLSELVRGHRVAVSLLPYTCHHLVAEAAVTEGRHMVTTSYVSDVMRGFDERAREKGVILMNEMGLDPGIDHMEAQRVIDHVHERGGTVKEFISYCGGLPAPEANTNPWGYKFSWSPKGVVLASRNSARFKRDGRIMEIPGKELFASYEMVEIPGLGSFEGYPNRDSVPYADVYGIHDARTVLRGTLRNIGWCDTWKGLHDIGILDEKPTSASTFRELMEELAPGEGDLEERLKKRIDTRDNDRALHNWKWLGMLSDESVSHPENRMDSLSELLERKLRYGPSERDMIILQHTFRVELPGEGEKVIRSTMIDYGIPGGDSAMSRTVGIPAAIGAEMILNGELDDMVGVQIPTHPDVYGPALDRLKLKGIEFRED